MDPQRLELFVPSQFVDPNGLVRLGELGRPAAPFGEAEVVKRILGRGPALAIASPPSFFDQVHIWLTHQELLAYIPEAAPFLEFAGSAEITADQLVDRIRRIPFGPAMRFVSSLQKAIGTRLPAKELQRQLMYAIYGEKLGVAGDCFLRAHDRGSIFFEQQLFALQRLLVLYASDERADELTPEQHISLRIALLYLPGTLLRTDDDVGEASDFVADERWLRYFVGNGGFVSHGSLLHETARAHRMYEVIAKSRLVRGHPDFCPIDEWLIDAYGMTFVELQSFGFVVFAGSRMNFDDGPPVAVDPSYFDSTAFRARTAQGFTALAADRGWFQREFQRSKETPRRVAFETHPFLRRPGLLQDDGTVLIVAPRAVQAWLGASGTYYRLLDIARGKGSETRKKFTRFNGELQEHYARHLMHVAHPDQRRRSLIAVGSVSGPRSYRRGKSMGNLETSDIAIDLGFDLVLIEVTAGRLTEKSLVEADAESVKSDLEKMIEKKMRQLGRVIADIFDDPTRLPSVDLSMVKTVWPVVVSGEGLFQNPTLWAYTNERAGNSLRFEHDRVAATVKPIVILDLEELEVLAGMVGAGLSLIEILERKTSTLWLERDFKAMVGSDFAHRWDEEPKFIVQEYRRAAAAIKRAVAVARQSDDPKQLRTAA